jgi:hypothetical protein
MSNPLRISLVAEGVTDYVVLKAAIEVVLNGRAYNLKLLQPDESVAFTGQGKAGVFGGGWPGVLKWMLATVGRAGNLANDPLFLNTDILILHLDADVASVLPAQNNDQSIAGLVNDLPCAVACPPASDTTDRLRTLMLKWVGEVMVPPNTVLCTPSKSTEAWVVALFFPTDKEMNQRGLECHPNPAKRLAVQPKAVRFPKSEKAYVDRYQQFKNGWPWLVGQLSEAQRFQNDFAAAAGAIPP